MDQLHTILNAFLKLGGLVLLAALIKAVVARLPQNTVVHSGHAVVATILTTAVQFAERLIKGVLTGPYLDQVIQAVAGGTALPVALSAQLPNLVQALRTAIGPKGASALDLVLGAAGSQQQLEAVVVSAAHDLLLLHKNAAPPPAPTPLPTPPTLPAPKAA